MAIRRSQRRLSAAKLTALARRLLSASPLCSIATVAPTGRAHVNAAYFAWSQTFDVVWWSAPQSRHSRNIKKNPSTAIVVYDSHQTWGRPDRGIMLYGDAREVTGDQVRAAEKLYARRFRAYEGEDADAYRFYRFRPQRLKIFYERELGAGVFVTARTRDGVLTWERTETYE